MTGIPRSHIYQSTLLQSTGRVWNPGGLDPSLSTRMANPDGSATCFSSISSAAISVTHSVISIAVIGQALPVSDV